MNKNIVAENIMEVIPFSEEFLQFTNGYLISKGLPIELNLTKVYRGKKNPNVWHSIEGYWRVKILNEM